MTTPRDSHSSIRALVTRILEGDGEATPAVRRAAFDNTTLDATLRTLVEKVANQPTRISADDFVAAKASGATEEQLFEIVVCAAAGAAHRQYERAIAALDAATPKGD